MDEGNILGWKAWRWHIRVMSHLASRLLKSPAKVTDLPFVHANNIENIKARITGPLWNKQLGSLLLTWFNFNPSMDK